MKRALELFALFIVFCPMILSSWAASAQAEETTLTIANLNEMDAAYFAFLAEHPNIQVRLLDDYVTDKQILEAVITRSDVVDIYCMFVNEGAYSAMYDRGFLYAMDELLPFVEGMLPQVRARIEQNGHLVALPYTFSVSGGFTYDLKVMNKLGLSENDLSKTWPEFLGFINTWTQRYATQFPEISPFEPSQMQNLKQWLFYQLYNDYCTHLDSLDDVPSFDTALFNQLLSAFEAVDFDAIQSAYGGGLDWLVGDALFGQNDDIGFVPIRESVKIPFSLMLDTATGPYYGATLLVYIINPYSKNQDAAISYLSTAAQHMNVYTRFTLVPQEAVPMRAEDYEEIRDNFQNEIEMLKRQWNGTEGNEKTYLEMQIADMENRWVMVEERLWTVNDELIARYKAQLPGIVVYQNGMNGGFEGTGDEGVHRVIERYLSGQMNRDAFIAQLNQKVAAMVMEGR